VPSFGRRRFSLDPLNPEPWARLQPHNADAPKSDSISLDGPSCGRPKVAASTVLMISLSQVKDKPTVTAFAFAPPRVGNFTFLKEFSDTHRVKELRVCNKGDEVPRIPGAWPGWPSQVCHVCKHCCVLLPSR
jgi:hypothetical protein